MNKQTHIAETPDLKQMAEQIQQLRHRVAGLEHKLSVLNQNLSTAEHLSEPPPPVAATALADSVSAVPAPEAEPAHAPKPVNVATASHVPIQPTAPAAVSTPENRPAVVPANTGPTAAYTQNPAHQDNISSPSIETAAANHAAPHPLLAWFFKGNL